MSKKPGDKRTWKPKPGAKLSPQEERLAVLIRKGTKRISALYRAIVGKSTNGVPPRFMQQRIGSIATRYNIKKPSGPHICAGRDKTYEFRRVL
jgi:hypothetical protein